MRFFASAVLFLYPHINSVNQGMPVYVFFFSFLSDMLATAILSSTQLLAEFKMELESAKDFQTVYEGGN
jgi:hypothetical protein